MPDAVAEAQRNRSHEIESGRLSGKETDIVIECDKALLVLHEDGTAVAFPEAVGQMRDDMQQIVLRLAETKVSNITQAICAAPARLPRSSQVSYTVTVSVRTPKNSTAPISFKVSMGASASPAAIAGRASGSAICQKVCEALRPRVRLASMTQTD